MTCDFATAQMTASFTSDGSATDHSGLGVEVVGNTVYYTGVAHSGGIHVAPYNNGLGGADTAVLPNPRPGGQGFGIQDLDYRKGVLYALTGFPFGPPIVYGLNSATGAVISSVAIQDHPENNADGFTVLPNGNFLINDGDESPTYRAYNPTTGNPTGFVFTQPAGIYTTGVDYNSNDNRLYFNGAYPDMHFFLARTKLDGTFLGSVDVPVDVPETTEDISVIASARSFWSGLTGNWNDDSMWTEYVPNFIASEGNFGDGNPGPSTANLDMPAIVGTLNLDSPFPYTIAGANNLTFDVVSGAAAINVLQGSHTISAPITLNADLDVSVVSASVLTLSGDLSAAGRSITKSGAGMLQVKNVRADALAVNAGIVRVIANGTAVGVSRVGALSVAPGAQLDLSDNDLVTATAVGTWNGSAYTGVTALIQSGRNGGGWGGSGIVTSQSSATGGNFTSIAVATAAQVKGIADAATTIWAGQTVTGTDTLVMYTYGGDANLDGKINVDDYGRIDFNVNLGTAGWFNGDFNYDGKINVDDYGIIDFNVGIQGPPFSTAAGEAGSSLVAVPEPAAVGGMILMSLRLPKFARVRRRPRGR